MSRSVITPFSASAVPIGSALTSSSPMRAAASCAVASGSMNSTCVAMRSRTFKGILLSRRERPDRCDQRNARDDDEYGQRQAELPVVAEAVAPRAHDERVALVTERGEEVARCADRDRHEKRVRIEAQTLRETRRNGCNHQYRRRVV